MNRTLVAATALAGCFFVPTRSGFSTVANLEISPPAEQVEAVLPEPEPLSVAEMLAAAVDACAGDMPAPEREDLARSVLVESQRHGYDPLFIQAMLEVESACDPEARGVKGSIGLIQLRPETARAVAAGAGMPWRGAAMLRESSTNIRLAVLYLSQLEERFSDPYLALAAYNLGPTKVAQLPPARARRSTYVRKVLRRYHELLVSHTAHES